MTKSELDQQEQFYKTFEWKGRELYPFSEGRKAIAMSIGVRMGGGEAPCLTDIHAILFICLSDFKTLAPGHRNPDALMEKVLEWADGEIKPEDYADEADLAKRILENAFSSRASAVEEPGASPAEPGN